MIKTVCTCIKTLFTCGDSTKAEAPSKFLICISKIFWGMVIILTVIILWLLIAQLLGRFASSDYFALGSLLKYLMWVQAVLLGLALLSSIVGGSRRRKEIADKIDEHQQEQREYKRKQECKHKTTDIADFKAPFTAIVKRDYQLDNKRTLSIVELKDNNENKTKGWFKFYELNKTYKGLENVVSKTCIEEDEYLARWYQESASGKFRNTGIYLLDNVPGRSGIFLHHGGSEKKAHHYIKGGLMPYKTLDKNTICGSREEMHRFVEITEKKDVVFQITS